MIVIMKCGLSPNFSLFSVFIYTYYDYEREHSVTVDLTKSVKITN